LKTPIILYLLFFTINSCLSQTNDSQIESKSYEEPVISAKAMNILYQGIDNPLAIALPNHECADMLVKATNGILTGNNCDYSIKPKNLGKSEISVLTITNKDTILHGKWHFRVKRIPNPIASFCGEKNSDKEIKIGKVKTCVGLILYHETFDFDVQIIAKEYDLIIYKADCTTIRLKSHGPRLTDEMNSALEHIETGETIVFENILAEAPNGTKYNIQDLRLKIK
jgi:hypothetical protein